MLEFFPENLPDTDAAKALNFRAAAYACISRPSSDIPPPSSDPFLLFSASSSGDFLTVPVENLKFYLITI